MHEVEPVVDGIVDDFMKENPDIKVKAIYAGNYNDARIKALAALKSGEPAQLSPQPPQDCVSTNSTTSAMRC